MSFNLLFYTSATGTARRMARTTASLLLYLEESFSHKDYHYSCGDWPSATAYSNVHDAHAG